MLGKRFMQSALTVAMVVVAVVIGQAPALAQAYGPYYLISFETYRCLDNPNGSVNDNTRIIVYSCGDRSNQRWYNDTQPAPTASPGQYWIKNQVSGKCLTVQNASMNNNAPVIQYSCNLGANEVWTYELQGYDYYVSTPKGIKHGNLYKIKNQQSQKCLTVTNQGNDNGATLVQFDCDSPGYNLFLEASV